MQSDDIKDIKAAVLMLRQRLARTSSWNQILRALHDFAQFLRDGAEDGGEALHDLFPCVSGAH